MNRYLADTNIFVYARGTEHRYREPCRAALLAAGDGLIVLEASIELVQEFAHILLRRGARRTDSLAEVDEVRAQCRLHAFDREILAICLDLLERYPQLGVRDAVHAATAVRHDIGRILSTDQVFDEVREIDRIDPIDAMAAIDALRDD